MEWIHFPPGEEPRVLTADLCKEFGGCLSCPDFIHAGKLELKGKIQRNWSSVSMNAIRRLW
jgi:hypothetical protein